MGDVDINGDGLVDMRIDATAQAIGALLGKSDELAGALGGLLSAVDAKAALLGKGGNLSDEFMKGYKARRDGAGGAADPGLYKAVQDVPGLYRKLGDVGNAAVMNYREAEQNAAGQFPS